VDGKATFFNLRAAKHVSDSTEELINREDLPRMNPEQWNFTILKNQSKLNKNKRMIQLEEYRRVPEEKIEELVNILWFKALQRLD
jgi:hypothetical protein